MDKRIDSGYQVENESVETESEGQSVDFESEMPVIEEDDVEFVPDEQADEDLVDTDEI